MLEILVSATQDGDNKVEHKDQVHEQEENLVVLSDSNDNGEILPFNEVCVLENLHIPLSQTGFKKVNENCF